MEKKRPGMYVTTKSGQKGKVYNDEKPIGGRVRVWIEQGGKFTTFLCNPSTLTQHGFFD